MKWLLPSLTVLEECSKGRCRELTTRFVLWKFQIKLKNNELFWKSKEEISPLVCYCSIVSRQTHAKLVRNGLVERGREIVICLENWGIKEQSCRVLNYALFHDWLMCKEKVRFHRKAELTRHESGDTGMRNAYKSLVEKLGCQRPHRNSFVD